VFPERGWPHSHRAFSIFACNVLTLLEYCHERDNENCQLQQREHRPNDVGIHPSHPVASMIASQPLTNLTVRFMFSPRVSAG